MKLLPNSIWALLLPIFLVNAKRAPESLHQRAAARSAAAQAPQVVLPDGTGTVTGLNLAQFSEEAFLGIPYAQAPTGNLRFAKPAALTADSTRAISASQFGLSCIQAGAPTSDISEDCLNLNIVRPAGLPSSAALPVVVFVYGGGFVSGSGSSYNQTGFVLQSMMRGQPVIFVTFNYRLGAFGFLSATEIAAASSTAAPATLNAGLYDMQLVLQWIQNNIGAFGGDKSKVTAYGQSAGAIALGSLLLADGGQAVSKLSLFRAAILESGSASGQAVPPPAQADPLYALFASKAGCPISSNSTSLPSSGSPTLTCLRAASADTIYTAQQAAITGSSLNYAYERALDGYFHDRAPSEAISAGRVAWVPLISGNVLDEGTDFAPTNVADASGIQPYYDSHYPTSGTPDLNSALNTALGLYPDDPTQGCPYNPTDASPSDRFYGSTNQFKRLASLVGDFVFHGSRRYFLSAYQAHDASANVYSYLFATPTPGQTPSAGVAHGSDLAFIYGDIAFSNLSNDLGNTSIGLMNAWIAFANTLSPNADDLPTWPKYGSSAGNQMLQFLNGTTTVITDNYRANQIAFLTSDTWTSNMYI